MTVTLRPWRTDDAADLAAAIGNPRVQANLRDGLPLPYTEADALDYIAYAAHPEHYAFAIDADGRAVGSIAVTRGGNIHRRTGELGYYLAEPYWHRGIATEAVRQMTAWVFSHTDLLRVYAEPFSGNCASRRVLEKAGYRHEGTMRANAVKAGRVLDMELYAAVRADYMEQE